MRFEAIVLNLIVSLAFPLATLAAPKGVPKTLDDLYGVVCRIGTWFFALVLVIAVITFLRGAFEFFTSGGNEQKVSHAKQLFFYAIIGTAIALLSKTMVIVIGKFLNVTNTGSFFGTECGG
jgi:hypothetical protein